MPSNANHKNEILTKISEFGFAFLMPSDKSDSENYFSYISNKTYVVGTQKNHLIGTELLLPTTHFKTDCVAPQKANCLLKTSACLTLFILVTSKQVFWQTVKTQLKCCIR